jgi:exonuclease III
MKKYDCYGLENGVFVVVKDNLNFDDFVELLNDLGQQRFRYTPIRFLNAFVRKVSLSTILTEKEKINLLTTFSQRSETYYENLRTSLFNIIMLADIDVLPTEIKIADFKSLIQKGFVYKDDERFTFRVGGFDIERTVSTIRLSPLGVYHKKSLLIKANEVADKQLRILQTIGKL